MTLAPRVTTDFTLDPVTAQPRRWAIFAVACAVGLIET